ncbi:hypothetical protein IOQ59_06010 [Pontibacterium sp. N1Y112]|uniref:DUF2357 domain-containing protein n=1 Tax=Pontibacterium sinense TaxID=2781979 RepID=A0A8J7FBT6_9GAMM|nr:hypothetical protein [Pontibacterium sinense]MBE9396816.1 hypothetical protein [Pontibacterium sinense]
MLFDRLTQQKISERDVPSPFIAARYKLLANNRINDHTELASGSILAEDGSERVTLEDCSFACSMNEGDKDQQNVELALLQISELIDFEGRHFPSPLLPSRLFNEKGVLNELEVLLGNVIDRGHLHEISCRPRFDMRYDEMVLPVSRAKRLAHTAERHLAAHSECWQRRTLTGIQPRKIMGMVSEDEFHLYENRVYVRLLDRLEQFLARRIQEIEALTKNLTDALRLEGSDQINYRLSRKLYSIWGETFTNDGAALEALDSLEKTLKQLQKQHQSIRGLIQQKFYRLIPKSAQVAGQVEQTNILSHDQHYRHLPKIWNTLRKENHNDNLTPEETLEANVRKQAAYFDYCGSVVFRALKELGYNIVQSSDSSFDLTRLSNLLRVSSDGSHWEVTSEKTGACIRLVPIVSWVSEGLRSYTKGSDLSIPCCLYSDHAVPHPSAWIDGADDGPLVLSPLDFYVEERVVSLFSVWLLKQTAQKYGQEIDLIPKSVMKMMADSSAFEYLSSKSCRLVSLPSCEELGKIGSQLKTENASLSLAVLNTSVDIIKELEQCPCCQRRGSFTQRDDRCFIGQCDNIDCKLEWEASLDGSRRILSFKMTDQTDVSFCVNGRWSASIGLD